MIARPARLTCTFIATLTVTACGGPGVVNPGVSPELKHSWEVAFNRGDGAAIASLYSEDAQLVMSGSPPVRGRAAIRAAVETMIKSGVKVRIGTAQNTGSGNLAYVYGHYAVLDHDGAKRVEEGSYLEIWRRRGDTWLIDLDLNAVGPAISASP
jgi:uncharacterized protein (TIGR02246 family)